MKDLDEDERLKDCFMDLLNQSCGKYDREKGITFYDSLCMSTYEGALELAVDFGWIKKEQVLR